MREKRKIFLIIFFSLIFLLQIFKSTKSFAMSYYYKTDFSTGLVTASILNIRSGPGTNYKIVGTVKKNEYIRVFAGIGNWYVVQAEGDYVGVVSKQYIKAIYPSTSNSNNTSTNNNTSNNTRATTSTLSADEKEVFNLINQQRINNGLSALKIDEEVQKVARIKAQDMVNNNYFAHESPTYGTPFQMLKNYGISYKTAGENIAGNSSNTGAVNAWMNSPGHKANILNSSFNYTGIGIVNSNKYGKIYVQMFTGK